MIMIMFAMERPTGSRRGARKETCEFAAKQSECDLWASFINGAIALIECWLTAVRI